MLSPPQLSRLQGSPAEHPNYAQFALLLTEALLITPDKHWYAIKIFTARPQILSRLGTNSIETFVPMRQGKPFLGSLVFLRCSENYLYDLKSDWFSQIVVYRDAMRTRPEPIPDKEMDNFRLLLSHKDQDLIPIEVKDPNFLVGDRVRVKDGALKGLEGVVKRIKGDRRLVVAINGICAVATSFIPPQNLEPVAEDE